MNTEFRKNRKEFLIGKKYKLPLKYAYPTIVGENEGFDTRGEWIDEACSLKDIYLKKKNDDTIFGQMLVIEIELDELRESKENEKDAEELKSIDSKIKKFAKSLETRKKYLRIKIGDHFEDWCAAKRKSLNIEFWEGLEQQVISGIDALQKSINDNTQYSGRLKEEMYDNPTYSYVRDSSDEIEYEIRYSENEINKERARLEAIKEAAKAEGVVL